MKLSNVKNKIVLVTGASSGIGEALSIEYARKGAKLVLFARRKDRLDALQSTIAKMGGESISYAGDVNILSDLENAVNLTVKTFSRLDVVIANAGFGVVGDFENLTEEDYRRQFETNVYGVLKTAKAALPELKKSRGNFTVMGSVLSYFSTPGAGAYSMSKYAIRAFSESLKNEVKKYGVSVTLICPGLVESELRRVDNQGKFHANADNTNTRLHMRADLAAKKMICAISHNCRESVVTVHGKILVFFAKHFAWFLDKLLGSGILKGRKRAGNS